MNKPTTLFQDSSALAEGNARFVEDLYEKFLRDPDSVDPSWVREFAKLGGSSPAPVLRLASVPPVPNAVGLELSMRKQAAVSRLIDQYRMSGHQAADNNPLKMGDVPHIPELDPRTYGLTEQDMDTPFFVDILTSTERRPLRQIIADLHSIYCGSTGFEYSYIVDTEIREWIQHRVESTQGRPELSQEKKRWLLKLLTAAESMEKYLHRKYVGQKRFSLEGGESLIPLLDELIQHAGAKGVREIVIGMAHRGRLNVLVNILGKKPELLFLEFEEAGSAEPIPGGAGDVKYHLGFSSDAQTPGGPVHLALAFNPSHLESVSSVVEGSVRARQDRFGQDGESGVLPVVIHGDAAFAGQGVVMETFNMAETPAYTTGGTIHVVINNQIGFTISNPFEARSTLYCTDVANMVQAPVFHVNGDDPEAVLFVTLLAVDYRMKFKRDVVIDLICFRRHGHNEVDEPAVTQPLMYRFIRSHPGIPKIYSDRLAKEGVVASGESVRMDAECQHLLDQGEPITRPTLRDASNYIKTRWDHYIGKIGRASCRERV